jgi:hypothetical protein
VQTPIYDRAMSALAERLEKIPGLRVFDAGSRTAPRVA